MICSAASSRPKWADVGGVHGSRVGQPLPVSTFVWTLGLQSDDGPLAQCWTVDQIAPEAPLSVPRFEPNARSRGSSEPPSQQ